MKNEENKYVTGRRDALKTIGLGSAAMLTGGLGNMTSEMASQQEKLNKPPAGLPPVKIKSVKAIGVRSAPDGRGSNLVVVKVETTEPGLYGLGCATFTQRALAVVTAVDSYLNDFCVGRDVDNIEDMWHSAYVSSYWRNGPVLNNALSGLDQALWDIKGKRANMPVYQLLGGKCRFAIETLGRGNGATPEEVADNVLKEMSEGYRYFRIGSDRGGGKGDFQDAGFGLPKDGYIDDLKDLKDLTRTFEVVRKRCGDEVLLGHDLHERYQPRDVINFCRNIEQYGPISFIEDPLSPENTHWWKQMRESTIVPFAMGELFNNVNEFLDPMVNHYFDFIRIHVSQMGGITPCMKVAKLGEWFNVRTIWHGPGDVSPVGHSAMAHMDLATWNFGAQEGGGEFSDFLTELFPGCLTKKGVYIHVNELPGLGIDINEKMAAKYPITVNNRNAVRKKDGTVIRS